MRRSIKSLLAILVMSIFLTACGGSGTAGPAQDSSVTPNSANVVSKLSVHADKMVYEPAQVGGNLLHLTDGTSTEKEVSFQRVSAVYWNDESGFHSADPQKGMLLHFNADDKTIDILGPPLSATGGTITFVADGKEYSINTDKQWLTMTVDSSMIASVLPNHLITVSRKAPILGNVSTVTAPPSTPVPAPANSEVNVAVVGGKKVMTVILPILNGSIVNMSGGDVPITVGTWQVVWNGFNALWYPSGGVKVSVLSQNLSSLITIAGIPETDKQGNLCLVNPAGNVYWFNTDHVVGNVTINRTLGHISYW